MSDKQKLINRLEEDLLASRGGDSSLGGGSSRSTIKQLSGLGLALSPKDGDDGAADSDADGQGGQDSSMLRVLCSQRDRCAALKFVDSIVSFLAAPLICVTTQQVSTEGSRPGGGAR